MPPHPGSRSGGSVSGPREPLRRIRLRAPLRRQMTMTRRPRVWPARLSAWAFAASVSG